ncbi:MAG: hypothetical protein CMK75_03605 [Pseudomonadales bacterium]|nr:hypothetical protein [Pseudomonadales bacterium]
MTASKPAVVGYFHSFMVGDEFKVSLSHFTLQPDAYKSVFGDECEAHPVIRLTEHEAVIAELSEQKSGWVARAKALGDKCDQLEAARAADKARIKLLEEQRDAFTMHKLASRQCTGIPRSVGISEPVEGFEDRPQDLAPAMREMALIIEADKARIAELEAALSECAPVMRAHAGASHMLEGFKPRRNEWDDLCDRIDEALAQQGKEGEA